MGGRGVGVSARQQDTRDERQARHVGERGPQGRGAEGVGLGEEGHWVTVTDVGAELRKTRTAMPAAASERPMEPTSAPPAASA